ncbi:MAG: ferrochelatase [Betaproteobacteria bacterium]|nr:ferrochelatase [Betaproteobacteria bacterium]MDH5210197.1 ferrochelatase [Betaproteobacteria bacterium]
MRDYLAEFLSDPRVVELPRWLWLPILHGVVLRKRPAESAKKYAKVWTAEGSPLAVHTARQAQLLRAATGLPVAYAMRYGEPSIASALRTLPGNPRIVSMYPQYARSTTESIRDLIGPDADFVEQFHEHPGYIAALAGLVEERPEVLVMSFHGLPQRAVERGDPYQDQCLRTARLLAESLRLPPEGYRVTFQSRFGPARWLQPYTSEVLAELGAARTRRVHVICPGFVADCLETLEEIAIEGRKIFLDAGGGEFRALPCLNESPRWIAALAQIATSSRA